MPDATNLGSANAGNTISGTLGSVTVADTRPGVAGWTAIASATDLTTGGTPAATISRANIAYWSGPVTAFSGAGLRTPGETTAAQSVPMAASVPAFSAGKAAGSTSTTWTPTLVLTIPFTAVAGTYTAVISHSVA